MTEYGKHKEAFIEEQIDLKKLLDQVDEVIYQFKYVPRVESYSFTFASESIREIYEVTPEEIKNDATPLFNRIHPKDVAKVLAAIKRATQNLSSWDYEYRLLLPKKGVRWVRGKSTPKKQPDGSIIWSGSVRDITDKKQIEIELLEKKNRLKMALASSQDGIWDWDLKTQKVFYSEESHKMLKAEHMDLENNPDAWSARVHPDDLNAYYKDIEDHFSGKTEHYVNEHRVKRNDGKYIWILDRGKVIEWDEEGKPSRVIGTHSDITEIKNKEENAVKMLTVVAEQNKRLLNFAHIVSHNLRSHSGNFQSLLGMMDQADSAEEKEELLDYIKKVSEGLAETIVHLNEVVNVQTESFTELRQINLYDYVEKTCNILKGDIEQKSGEVINAVPEDLTIDYNSAYLESVLLNLISNGLKYSSKDRNPKVVIDTYYEEGSLVLRVTDNGRGINLEKHGEDIFGMYKTFHGNADAKGIGLFITKNQIEAMGGSISVTSVVNEGSVFKIYF